MSCVEPRKALRECPLLDAVAFRSIKLVQQQKNVPIFMRDGNSVDFGRCNKDGCQQPAVGPSALLFEDRNAKLGSAALQLAGRSGGWISFWNGEEDSSSKMAGASGFTVEAWIKPADSSAWVEDSVAFVVAGLNFAVGILKHSGVLSVLAYHAGPAPASSCWEKRRLNVSSGVIGDGPSNEPRSAAEGNSTCQWIIAPVGASKITLIFTELSLTKLEYVRVFACNDADCLGKTRLRTVYDHRMPPPITSHTGIMQVIVNFDFVAKPASPGFTATFAASYPSVSVSPGIWQHIAVSTGLDGVRHIFINGTVLQTDAWDWDLVAASPFDRGGSIGRRATFWQDKYWRATSSDDEGYFYGSIDELKIWKRVRTSADIQSGLLQRCSSLEIQSKSGIDIVACFSFDEVREGGRSFSDETAGNDKMSVHPQTRSGDSPPLAWCQGLDDDGKAPADDGDELWGFCSLNRPRLPGAGFDYDVFTMEIIASLAADTVEALVRYPGCGELVIKFRENRARTNGGAVYYDSCQGLDDWNDCFIQLSTERAASFDRNTAGKAGGGIFVDCFQMGRQCEKSFSEQNKLGSLLLPRAEFRANTANSYGSEIATRGHRMTWLSSSINISTCDISIDDCRQLAAGLLYSFVTDGDYATKGCYCYSKGKYARTCWYGTINGQHLTSETQLNCPDTDGGQSRPYACAGGCGASTTDTTKPFNLNLIPGQDTLSLEILLYDDTGTRVRGTSDVVEVRICHTSGICSTKDALIPSTYFGFDQETGIAHVETRVECPFGVDTSFVEVVLVGSDFVPALHGNIRCGACQAGQRQLSRKAGDVSTSWWCDKCLPTTYIIDRFGPCRMCPKGATCPDGSLFVPKANGSEWKNVDGHYRVEVCPQVTVQCTHRCIILVSPF